MAKLYFKYAAMNAGKSTMLLQVAYNYEERGHTIFLLTSAVDTRAGVGVVKSRLGISREAIPVKDTDSVTAIVDSLLAKSLVSGSSCCLLVDEAQFFTADQIVEMHKIAHCYGMPVMCFGIRTDFKGNLFPGSERLLALADSIEELKTICRCGKKATMNARFDENGDLIKEGDQVLIGGNSTYESVCPTKFYTGSCKA